MFIENDRHIHIVSFDIPYPANYGGIIDVFYKIKALNEHDFKVHLHCFEYGRKHAEELKNICFSVNYYKRNMSFINALKTKPYIVTSRQSRDLINNLLNDNYPILLEGLHTCSVLSDNRLEGRKIFVRTHNIEHDYYQALAKTEKRIKNKIYLKTEAIKLRRFEPILKKATAILAISNNDYNYLCRKYKNVFLIPAFCGFNTANIIEGDGEYVLYHGNLSVSENYDIATYLIEKIFKDSEIKLIIAGKNPPAHLIRCAEKETNVTLVKNPDDKTLQQLIQNAHINILLTAQSTGLKLKLLNALYNGRFCIVNNKMTEGLGIDNQLPTANTDEEIKTTIDNLMRCTFDDKQLHDRKLLLEKHFNCSETIEKLVDTILSFS